MNFSYATPLLVNGCGGPPLAIISSAVVRARDDTRLFIRLGLRNAACGGTLAAPGAPERLINFNRDPANAVNRRGFSGRRSGANSVECDFDGICAYVGVNLRIEWNITNI